MRNKLTALDSKGQLLIEMLIAIMVAAVIVIAVSNLFFVNMKEGKFTENRFDALMLAQEGMEAVNSVAESSWHNIYLPPMGSGSKDDKGDSFVYCLKNDASSWSLTNVLSDCEILNNGIAYTRKIIISNANRDNGNISESSGTDDPSTQKVKIIISYGGGKDVSLEEYITRWKNRILKQDSWASTAPTNQAQCESLLGTWDVSRSICIASLTNPANESGWDSLEEIESAKIDTGAGALKFK